MTKFSSHSLPVAATFPVNSQGAFLSTQHWTDVVMLQSHGWEDAMTVSSKSADLDQTADGRIEWRTVWKTAWWTTPTRDGVMFLEPA